MNLNRFSKIGGIFVLLLVLVSQVAWGQESAEEKKESKLEFGPYINGKTVYANIYTTRFQRIPVLTLGETTTVEGDVSFSSSDTQIATVDEKTGEVAISQENRTGQCVITASFPGNEEYLPTQTSYTLDVLGPQFVPIYIDKDGVDSQDSGKYTKTWTYDRCTLIISCSSKEEIELSPLYAGALFDFKASDGQKIKSVKIWVNQYSSSAVLPTTGTGYDGSAVTGTDAVTESYNKTDKIHTISSVSADGVSELFISLNKTMDPQAILVELLPSSRSHSVTVKSESAGGLTTMFLDYASVIPEGCTAYYASTLASDGSSVGLVKCEDRVARNQGVIVHGIPGSSYEFTESTEITEQPASNYLCGFTTSDVSKYLKEGYVWYYLTTGGNFKKYSGSELTPYKAYLYLPDSSKGNEAKPVSMYFVDTPSSLSNNVFRTTDSDMSKRMYNLSGQEVGRDYRGVVIMDGKKVWKY